MMFKDQTAWFSSSVDEKTKQIWRDHGGKEADFDTAVFVFSSDSTCADTEKVYQTEAYISEHLAVFHSCYIQDCVNSDDRSKVALGRYFLPPYDILAMVKKQMTLCWDAHVSCLKPSSSGHLQEQSADRPGSEKVCQGSSSPQQRNRPTVASSARNEQALVSTHNTIKENKRRSEMITSRIFSDFCQAGPSTLVHQTGRLQRRKIKSVVPVARNTTNQQLLVTARNSDTNMISASSCQAEGTSQDQSCRQKKAQEASSVVPHSPAKQLRGDDQRPEIQQTLPLETRDLQLQIGRTTAYGAKVMETVKHQTNITEESSLSQQDGPKSVDTAIDSTDYVKRGGGCLSHFEQGDSAHLFLAFDEHWKQNPVEVTVTFKRLAQITPDTLAEKMNSSVIKHGDSVPASSDIFDINMLPRVKISELSAFIPGKNGAKVFKKLL